MDIFKFLLELEGAKLVCLVFAGLLIFVGPTLIKKRYLTRNGISIDEQLEDRNSWLVFPKQYNLYEKFLLLFVYMFAFFLIIVAVNI